MSSVQYMTLEEAWGEALPPIRKKKKVPRVPADDALMDARLTGDARVPGDREYRAPSSADDYLAWSDYTKEDGQRTDAPLVGLDGPARVFPEKADVKVTTETAEVMPEPKPRTPSPALVLDSSDFGPGMGGNQDGPDTAAYDVAMYVFTGIMLILLLEQFIQIGVSLRRDM